MDRDPSVVSFTKVGAEVVAGVVGGFVDALSWRSLVSLCLSFLFIFKKVGNVKERQLT
jgi:hypothetical protein